MKDGARQGRFDGTALPTYRIASFGNANVRVTLQAGSFDPVLLIDGPYPGANPQVLANHDDAGPDDASSNLELTLEEAGTYRLIVGSYETFQDLPVEAGETEPPALVEFDLANPLDAAYEPEMGGQPAARKGSKDRFTTASSTCSPTWNALRPRRRRSGPSPQSRCRRHGQSTTCFRAATFGWCARR